jgi:DNA-directed RNA polymerase specialized sigma subunit
VRVFFNKEKMCDIAKECGVTKMAISNRIDRALAQLKKILKNFS